jgi:hypothetical protein
VLKKLLFKLFVSASSFPSKAVSMKIKNYFIKKFPAHLCQEMKVPSDLVFDGDKKIIFQNFCECL